MVPAISGPLSSQPCDTRRVLSNTDRMGHCPNQQWRVLKHPQAHVCVFLFRDVQGRLLYAIVVITPRCLRLSKTGILQFIAISMGRIMKNSGGGYFQTKLECSEIPHGKGTSSNGKGLSTNMYLSRKVYVRPIHSVTHIRSWTICPNKLLNHIRGNETETLFAVCSNISLLG